jgi:hypothetical protein
MGAFDAVGKEHGVMAAEAYNDDQVYKQKLNQVHACNVLQICGGGGTCHSNRSEAHYSHS